MKVFIHIYIKFPRGFCYIHYTKTTPNRINDHLHTDLFIRSKTLFRKRSICVFNRYKLLYVVKEEIFWKGLTDLESET